MTKIKICGLFREIDAEYANECMPDFSGFVFAEKSRRKVSAETARRLRRALDRQIQTVGVFQNADVNDIMRLCGDGTIDLVQLHGNEPETYIEQLKRLVDVPIIKAVVPSAGAALPETVSDYLLFDGKEAGSGKTFNWETLNKVLANEQRNTRTRKPFFLAGGINAGNAAEAIARFSPFCLDVSSGAELNGVKDLTKMREIINITRRL
jgi:phosphoribosylanthranilate isomerase